MQAAIGQQRGAVKCVSDLFQLNRNTVGVVARSTAADLTALPKCSQKKKEKYSELCKRDADQVDPFIKDLVSTVEIP